MPSLIKIFKIFNDSGLSERYDSKFSKLWKQLAAGERNWTLPEKPDDNDNPSLIFSFINLGPWENIVYHVTGPSQGQQPK